MTVAELRQRMSNREFVEWCGWHALRAQREQVAMGK
jgi:hypothetical protein